MSSSKNYVNFYDPKLNKARERRQSTVQSQSSQYFFRLISLFTRSKFDGQAVLFMQVFSAILDLDLELFFELNDDFNQSFPRSPIVIVLDKSVHHVTADR